MGSHPKIGYRRHDGAKKGGRLVLVLSAPPTILVLQRARTMDLYSADRKERVRFEGNRVTVAFESKEKEGEWEDWRSGTFERGENGRCDIVFKLKKVRVWR